MNLSFDKQVVLVTGASRGIGESISNTFASLGADVRRLSSSDFDLTCPEGLRAVTEYIHTLPRLDVCVNNAGINRINYLEDIRESDYDEIMHINAKAPFMIAQSAATRMKAQSYGRILNVTSIFGHCTKEKRLAYTTSKFALKGMTKTMAVELASNNILVNSIAPGFTATELTAHILGEEGMKEIAAQVPMRRLAHPQEIANVAIFLCSSMNTYLTGQNIIVDGGFVNV